MNTLAALALLIQTVGSTTFPDDHVTWTFGELDPVAHDRETGVLVYTAVPSADVGCTAPRFVVDAPTGTVLAVYCLRDTGDRVDGHAVLAYSLLATGGGR